MKLGISQVAVTKRRHKLIVNIANWEEWILAVNKLQVIKWLLKGY